MVLDHNPGAATTVGSARELLDAMTESIRGAGQEIVLDDPRVDTSLLEAEGFRYLSRFLTIAAASELEYHDPAYPNWCRVPSPFLNWGYPNPDGQYLWTMIDGQYDYRIYGTRGTNHLFDIEAWEGDYADLRNCRVTGGRRDIKGGPGEIEYGPDGTFEIILSKSEQGPNWIPIVDGLGHVYVRQWFYDWENEVQGQVFIERIGATYPAPLPTREVLEERLSLVRTFLRTVPAALRAGVEQHYAAGPDRVVFPDALLLMDTGKSVSFRNQFYARGYYECGPDEAVVLEVTPPKCHYWLFHLLSHYWEMLDWRYRQISINGHQAHIDDDGVFRAVIAHRDPGVPNWLDASGHPVGLIGGRYNWTDSTPEPTLRKVSFGRLAEELPANTPRISPEERSQQMRRRIMTARRRGTDW
jgi:hypothetical protein